MSASVWPAREVSSAESRLFAKVIRPMTRCLYAGVIKGNIGDQTYVLGSDLDLAKYRAVSIWCKRFSVNFGAAALRPTEGSQNY